ncbi:MAG: MAPEG family protein [Stappiaceae bacterium]
MTTLYETIPQLAAYHTSLLILAALCIIVLLQSFLTAPLAFVTEEQVPGMPLVHDHSRLSFRAMRTYANSTENLPAFGFSLVPAIIVGVAPLLVNWLAVLYLAFRVAFWVAYYSGFGKIAGGPRTICYVGGLLANLVLAGSVVYMLAVL